MQMHKGMMRCRGSNSSALKGLGLQLTTQPAASMGTPWGIARTIARPACRYQSKAVRGEYEGACAVWRADGPLAGPWSMQVCV